MMIAVKVKEYLENLVNEEKGKPILQRKPIPSVAAIAEASGVSRQGMYYFLSKKTYILLNLNTL